MTMALCFNCGHTKFGAICPCPKCKVASTGNMELDIVFSDHNYSVETLGQFGGVVRAIHGVCGDPQLCFWTFLYYVTTHHPEILKINPTPDEARKYSSILAEAQPPPVQVAESRAGEWKRKTRDEAPGADAT